MPIHTLSDLLQYTHWYLFVVSHCNRLHEGSIARMSRPAMALQLQQEGQRAKTITLSMSSSKVCEKCGTILEERRMFNFLKCYKVFKVFEFLILQLLFSTGIQRSLTSGEKYAGGIAFSIIQKFSIVLDFFHFSRIKAKWSREEVCQQFFYTWTFSDLTANDGETFPSPSQIFCGFS